jgi:DNA polymerase type B, organellar and viral
MIKAKVEDDIRIYYFGGNVEVYVNEIKEGFLYDMNSQYSKAMLNEMPIGYPSTEKYIDNIFGFVYGKVTAPSVDVFKVLYIQYKDPITGKVTCPRGSFNRMRFTEEFKYGIKQGYKFEVKFSYNLARGKGVFKDFVDTHF